MTTFRNISPKPNQIEHLILDIGGVVVELDWPATIEQAGIEIQVGERLLEWLRHAPVHHEYERGNISDRVFFEALNDQIGGKSNPDQLRLAWAKMIRGEIKGMKELMARVSKKIGLHALSNTSTAHATDVFPQLEAFRHFDHLMTSFHLKARKPEPAIYEAALQTIGAAPHQVLFLDDLPENVEAARRLGWNSELALGSADQILEILMDYEILSPEDSL